MTTNLATITQAREEVRGFVRRALADFMLLDAFERRDPCEQAACLAWIAGAADGAEEEARVSELLDCLEYGRPLPRRG